MSLSTALTLFVLCAATVHCGQENPICPRKESNPGVLVLKVGSEVILGCRGEVTVDSVPIVISTKHTEEETENRDRGDVTNHWTVQKAKESPGTMGIRYPETQNSDSTGKYRLNTVTGIYAKGTDSVTIANPAISPAKKQMGTTVAKVLQAINQATKLNNLGRVTEEGGAFSVTMEMGLSTKKTTRTEYEEEDEDYDENTEGLRVTRSIRRQARWTRNGKHLQDGVEHGGILRLPALQLADSGNYSCYRRRKLVSSIRISVGIPPESPSLSCHKKWHTSKIRCEWISRQPVIPHPQCYLLLRKGLQNITHVNCSYSVDKSRCWCAFPSVEGDRNSYSAKLCVTNIVGSAISSPYNYIPQNILKPDPPTRVMVKPVMGEPNSLSISWSLPATWRHSFYYFLQFQIRYRPIDAEKYQHVDIEYSDRLWLISDALSYKTYEIQIRAKDEYDGQWSDWTSSEYARTWTAPKTTAVPDINTSLEPLWTFPEGSGENESEVDIRPAADGDAVIWVYVLWVLGVCLFITIVSFSAYSLRQQIAFRSKNSKQSISSDCACSSPSPLLQQPPQSTHQEAEGEGIHLHNVDYFFPSCESSCLAQKDVTLPRPVFL